MVEGAAPYEAAAPIQVDHDDACTTEQLPNNLQPLVGLQPTWMPLEQLKEDIGKAQARESTHALVATQIACRLQDGPSPLSLQVSDL